MWIDAHSHLDFISFREQPDGQKSVIERAFSAGVEVIIATGVTLEGSRNSLMLAQKCDGIYAAVGVHPNEALSWDDKVTFEFLKWIDEDRKCNGVRRIVAIGEIGLDYFRDRVSKEIQQKVFRDQLIFAKKVNLPVVIHCRDAFFDVFRILEEEAMKRVVFHCYTGDLATAKRIWGNDWFTSFTAIIGYSKNDELRRVVADCPNDLYFLETDAPFLPPRDKRGQRNEPAFLVDTGKIAADIRVESVKVVEEESTKNAERFFGI